MAPEFSVIRSRALCRRARGTEAVFSPDIDKLNTPIDRGVGMTRILQLFFAEPDRIENAGIHAERIDQGFADAG